MPATNVFNVTERRNCVVDRRLSFGVDDHVTRTEDDRYTTPFCFALIDKPTNSAQCFNW